MKQNDSGAKVEENHNWKKKMVTWGIIAIIAAHILALSGIAVSAQMNSITHGLAVAIEILSGLTVLVSLFMAARSIPAEPQPF